MKNKILFVTYGSSNFNLQKKHIVNLAKNSKFFDETISYSPRDLDDSFKNKYSEVLSNNRGGGFWIWKNQILKQTVENLKENDLIVYSDAGSSLNLSAKNRFDSYIDNLLSSDKSTLRFKLDLKEKFWTTKEIFEFFGLDNKSKYGNSEQYLAGHMILKNNKDLKDQIQEFDNLLNYDHYLITNKYDNNQIQDFKENRHDQSVFSLLSKLYGCVEYENEVWFKESEEKQFDYPFLAVQQKKYNLWQKIKFYSKYKLHINSTIYFGKKLYSFQKHSFLSRFIFKIKSFF